MDRTVRVRLEAAVAGYQAAMGRASASTKAWGREVAQVSAKARQDMQTLGTAMTITGGAIVGTLGLATNAAIGFESAFAGVRKTVNASEAELGRLSSGLRDMATAIPTDVTSLAGIAEAAGQLGIATPNILGFTRTMADLGETTNLAGTEAATSLARLANITQMPQTEFDRLGSTVVALGNNFATTESEIVAMSLRIAGAGAQIGLTEADILGMSTALSSVGIEAEAGGTAISKVMIDIASEVETGGAKLVKFAQVAGMSAGQFAEAFRSSPTAAIVAFISGLGKIDEAGGSTLQVLEDLEITEVRMRDALLRSAGAGELLADAVDLGTRAWEDNTALADEAAQRYDTVEAKVQIAGNAINDMAITIGQTFTPAVGAGADAAAGLAGFISDLPQPAVAAVTIIGGLAAAVTLAGGAFLLAAPKIVATKAALDALAVSAPRTVGALQATGSFLAGPWGVALAAGTVGLGLWAKAQGDARRRIEEVKSTLDEQTGAITGNTREWAVNRLQQEGAVSAARDLGIRFETVVDAALGSATALATVTGELRRQREAYYDNLGGTDLNIAALENLQHALGVTTGEVEASTSAKREELEASAAATGGYLDVAHAIRDGLDPATASMIVRAQEAKAAAEGATGQTDAWAGAIGDVTSEAITATDAIDEFNKAVRGQFDPIFRVNDAMTERARIAKEIAETESASVGAGKDFETEADRLEALDELYRDQLDNVIDLDGGLRELNAAIEDGTVTVDGAAQMLEGWQEQGWLAAEAAAAFGEDADAVYTLLRNMSASEWNLRLVASLTGDLEDINRLAAFMTAQTGTGFVHVEGSRSTVVPKGVTRHAGGPIMSADAAMSAAGQFGLSAGEVMAKLKVGEFVVNPTAAGRHAGLLQAINAGTFHDGGFVAQPSSPFEVRTNTPPAMSGSSTRIGRQVNVPEGLVQIVTADARGAAAETGWELRGLFREFS